MSYFSFKSTLCKRVNTKTQKTVTFENNQSPKVLTFLWLSQSVVLHGSRLTRDSNRMTMAMSTDVDGELDDDGEQSSSLFSSAKKFRGQRTRHFSFVRQCRLESKRSSKAKSDKQNTKSQFQGKQVVNHHYLNQFSASKKAPYISVLILRYYCLTALIRETGQKH